jgi:hypothetical protein
MAVLERGAIDLNYRAGIAGKPFGRGFDQPGFPRPGRAQKEKIAIGRPGLDIPARYV